MHQGRCIFKLILFPLLSKHGENKKRNQHPNYMMFITFHPKPLLIPQPPQILAAISLCLSENELKKTEDKSNILLWLPLRK